MDDPTEHAELTRDERIDRLIERGSDLLTKLHSGEHRTMTAASEATGTLDTFQTQPSEHQHNVLSYDSTSVTSGTTYYTALSCLIARRAKTVPGQLHEGDEFAQLLQSQELWPVDPSVEQDWSGRGQHVTFQKHEQRLIDEILEVQDILGSTRTAVVQSVKCRRILLARKSITCGNRTMTKEEAIAEVAHLTRLSHAHIIRVIGTYVKGRELSILLYPVANSNLEVFLETLRTACMGNNYKSRDIFAVETFPGCLSSAVSYLHRKLTKHMDIKPQNILVVKTSAESCKRPLLADFGIARTYRSAEETETNGWTSFTKRYAAPEVVKQDFRGLPADIFSLGCIFLEILDTIDCIYSIDVPPSWLQAILRANLQSDTSYQGNIDALQNHLTSRHTPARHLTSIGKHVSVISMMLNLDPRSRPTAEDLVSTFGEKHCCKSGAIQLKRDLTFHSHGRISDHHDRYCGSFDNQTESITWYYC